MVRIRLRQHHIPIGSAQWQTYAGFVQTFLRFLEVPFCKASFKNSRLVFMRSFGCQSMGHFLDLFDRESVSYLPVHLLPRCPVRTRRNKDC